MTDETDETDGPDKPTQETPKGHEIPVPKKADVLRDLQKLAPKLPGPAPNDRSGSESG